MYHRENERDMLFFFSVFILAGIIIFGGFIYYCIKEPEIIPIISISLLFVIILITTGIKGVSDVIKRRKEIDALTENGKYLIGSLDSFTTPEYVVFTQGFKCAVFLCHSEIGRTYYFHSEPFDMKKEPFNKEMKVKIYVDDQELPKKHFVSDEYISE